jgi:hypothetical protein
MAWPKVAARLADAMGRSSAQLEPVIGFFGGGAALLAHIALYFRNASVFASETKFGMTTTLGRVRAWDRSQLARVVLTRVSYGAGLGAGRAPKCTSSTEEERS